MTTVRTEYLIPVKLISGTTHCTVLVDDRDDLAVGKFITLDDEELDPHQEWEVLWMGKKLKRDSINHDWKNNI